MTRKLPTWLRSTLQGLLVLAFAGGLLIAALYAHLIAQFPDIESLAAVEMQVPLRVYTREGALVAEYGAKRRYPVSPEQIPVELERAFIASEDDQFYEHRGVDPLAILRAAWFLITTGEKAQGGSTITMQVARNFLLSPEKTYTRKLKEIFLALRIDARLSKERILQLYLNKIYLGQGAYGVAAAAQVYYGKRLHELSLAEIATVAGLPKAPSRLNPIASPERAVQRRRYVLRRMHELGHIDAPQFAEASRAPVTADFHGVVPEVEAPYVAEMARERMVERFGKSAYTQGLRVYASVSAYAQRAGNHAARKALLAYDRRHGYRGPEARLGPEVLAEPTRVLADYDPVTGLLPALVSHVSDEAALAVLADGRTVRIAWEGLAWARGHLDSGRRGPAPERAAQVVRPGDVVRVAQGEGGWRLAQVPEVQGALVHLDAETGAVRALVGGFDFGTSPFNRAVQARRQPGSAFKPFVFSAALEAGFTAASIVNDAPLVFGSSDAAWRPGNYSGRVHGPMRLREALVRSINLVAVRVLRDIGLGPAIEHLERFGFDGKSLPRNLSLALGSAGVSPMKLAAGYAAFANGGYRVEPWMILRVEDREGNVLLSHDSPEPLSSPSAKPRAITPQNAYIMRSMLLDVVRRGTGRGARVIGRGDLGGKTGTTDEQRDAWFAGFGGGAVTVSWVGFDDNSPLGFGETGAGAALPMWIAHMRGVLEGRPGKAPPRPDGLIAMRIDPDTGLPAGAESTKTVFETFRVGHAPTRTNMHALDENNTATLQNLF